MGKKKKPSDSKRQQQPSLKVNPFELKKSKKKFEVLGRRENGQTKNVVKARADAITKVLLRFTVIDPFPALSVTEPIDHRLGFTPAEEEHFACRVQAAQEVEHFRRQAFWRCVAQLL
jgi:hypothetical protein